MQAVGLLVCDNKGTMATPAQRPGIPAKGGTVIQKLKLLVLKVFVFGVLAVPVAAQLDSATMTVGYTAQSLDGERFGYVSPSFNVGKGSLSPDRFRYGGRTYTIQYIEWLPQPESLVLGASRRMPDQFSLWLDGVAFSSSDVVASGDVDGSHYYYQWFPVAGDWSEGDRVEVRVAVGPDAVPAIPAAGLVVLLMLLAAAGVRRL